MLAQQTMEYGMKMTIYCGIFEHLSENGLKSEAFQAEINELIKQVDRCDLGPVEKDQLILLFNFGRYLLISSSRAGTQATNLQGIWSNSIKPSWNCNYTTNINTQMNYWPVLPCNMPELMMPLTDLIKTLSVTGEQTAKDFYNASGFVVHHNSDIWGFSYPVQGRACWAFWQGGSGWLCRSLCEIYEYTLDRNFLEKTAYACQISSVHFCS